MRLPHPPLFETFPLSFALRRAGVGDVRATQQELDAFNAFTQAGDPLADALVAEMRALPAGSVRRQFDRALRDGIAAVEDAPPALASFMAEIEAVPEWLDRGQLELAARTMTRSGLFGIYGPLLDVSLLGGYLSWRPGKVLVRSGDLERKAPARLSETSNWWVDVTTPGGLERFAPGFAGVARVRLMHAHVRAVMDARDDWDHEEWEAPINQVHMVGTIVLFSLIFVGGLQLLGFQFSKRERASIFHFWRYVGWLMGVDEALLPIDEPETWRVTWNLAATQMGPDEDSRRLAAALVGATPRMHGIRGTGVRARVATWAVGGVHAAYARLALGRSGCEMLGVRNRPAFVPVVLGFAAVNFLVESVRRLVPGATSIAVWFGGRSRVATTRRVARSTGADLSFVRDAPRSPLETADAPERRAELDER